MIQALKEKFDLNFFKSQSFERYKRLKAIGVDDTGYVWKEIWACQNPGCSCDGHWKDEFGGHKTDDYIDFMISIEDNKIIINDVRNH